MADEPTEGGIARNHPPNLVVTVAQVPPSERNNVEPSNAQSTADGQDTLHTVRARRAAVEVSWPVSDIAHIQPRDTTAGHAERTV